MNDKELPDLNKLLESEDILSYLVFRIGDSEILDIIFPSGKILRIFMLNGKIQTKLFMGLGG